MKITVKLGNMLVFVFVLLSSLLVSLPTAVLPVDDNIVQAKVVTAGFTLQQNPVEDKLVIGSSFTLAEGKDLAGSLYIIGGTVKISGGATVEKDIVMIGGNLEIDGTVGGTVYGLGGVVSLGSAAHIQGNVNTLSTYLIQNETAKIDGTVSNAIAGPFSAIIPNRFQLPQWNGIPPIDLIIPKELNPTPAGNEPGVIWKIMWWLIRSFIWAALAVLTCLFFPKAVDRVAEAVAKETIVSAGLGLVTVVIAPFILFLLAITICALPASLVLGLLIVIAWVLGVIAVGFETGKLLIGKLKLDWATPVSAAVGVFGLTLLSNGIGWLVPCIGWIVPAIIGVIGLGAVILTRFGTQG